MAAEESSEERISWLLFIILASKAGDRRRLQRLRKSLIDLVSHLMMEMD